MTYWSQGEKYKSLQHTVMTSNEAAVRLNVIRQRMISVAAAATTATSMTTATTATSMTTSTATASTAAATIASEL